MSIWRRVFRKRAKPQAATARLSLKEQFQRKGQRYLQILTASNAALEIMAEMQDSLSGQGYFCPAYVQVSSAAVLRHTGDAIRLLHEFSRDKHKPEELGKVFAKLADHINEELVREIKTGSGGAEPSPAALRNVLPFGQHLLAGPELLASGVAYPVRESGSAEELIIEGIWGWGPAASRAARSARRYRVNLNIVTEIQFPEIASSEVRPGSTLEPAPDLESPPPTPEGPPLLQEAEIKLLADYVRQLTSYYQCPQKVEWGLGADREIVILRSLPYQPPPAAKFSGSQPPELLLSGGISIYPGLAVGPAFPLETDHVPENREVPEGVVIIARKPSLALAPLLRRAAALVVATGEPYNHLAFLARELRLPTIFSSGAGTMDIAPEKLITVDATRLKVCAGRSVIPEPQMAASPGDPAARAILQRLRPRLFPLNVLALPDDSLTPAACQSIHDILYYTSKARVEEMFCLSLRGRVTKKDGVSLVTGRLVPILIIDAGEGLSAEAPTVNFAAIASIPYRAFLNGMMSIPWPKARPVDMKGFISVIGVTSTTPRSEEQLQKCSFALLSKNYMNFSLCLGYHASTIEAYVGANLDDNYIRFHYQGGAASLERRVRRLQLIGGVLSRLGFKVTVRGDLLDARLGGEPTPSLLQILEILGRLEVYTKQMDMVMSDDGVVSGYIADFFEKHWDENFKIPSYAGQQD